MELTSKEKKYLRGLGQHLPAIASVGKAGLSEGVVQGIVTLLEQHELIKVHIPAGSGPDRKEMADELARQAAAQCVGLVGRMVVLYRPNESLPPERRIQMA
jgi:RNA-binding protein